MDLKKYYGTFADESLELLDLAGEAILHYERTNDPERLNEVMRALHTIKGSAKIIGLDNLGHLAHIGEDIITDIIEGKIPGTKTVVNSIIDILNTIEEGISGLMDKGTDLDDSTVKRFENLLGSLRKRIQEGNFSAEEALAHVPKLGKFEYNSPESVFSNLVAEEKKILISLWESGKPLYHILITLAKDTRMKSARIYTIFRELHRLGNLIFTQPPSGILETAKEDALAKYGTKEMPVFILYSSDIEQIDIENRLRDMPDVVSVNIIPLDYTDVIKRYEGEGEGESEHKVGKRHKVMKTETIRVDVRYLDEILNLIGEAMIAQIRLGQMEKLLNINAMPKDMAQTMEQMYAMADINAKELLQVMHTTQTTIKEIQELVLKMRLVPLENIFMRFPRMVRDISSEKQKDVSLMIHGADTEIDRTLLDVVGDALLHIIRNAIDHGIEIPEERLRKGKPAEGKVEINAYREGSMIVIEVRDDGRGIDIAKVRSRAIGLGLITEEEANTMAEEDLMMLIFSPNFSTSEEVTEVSGRGIGLDAVRRSISEAGGRIYVHTRKDEGTIFKIMLPPVVAIMNALLIDVKGHIYTIPLESIVETIRYERNMEIGIHGYRAIMVRNKVIPLIDMGNILYGNGGGNHIIVVNIHSNFYGLLVDYVLDRKEVVVKPLKSVKMGEVTEGERYIASGATILEDGTLSLILDLESVIQVYKTWLKSDDMKDK